MRGFVELEAGDFAWGDWLACGMVEEGDMGDDGFTFDDFAENAGCVGRHFDRQSMGSALKRC